MSDLLNLKKKMSEYKKMYGSHPNPMLIELWIEDLICANNLNKLEYESQQDNTAL
jgi:hypothetical protein